MPLFKFVITSFHHYIVHKSIPTKSFALFECVLTIRQPISITQKKNFLSYNFSLLFFDTPDNWHVRRMCIMRLNSFLMCVFLSVPGVSRWTRLENFSKLLSDSGWESVGVSDKCPSLVVTSGEVYLLHMLLVIA